MTISSSTRKAGPFTGNGTTTSFPFTFKVFQASDLYVVLANTSVGSETVLQLTTHYTVSLNADQNTSPGGSVVLLSAPATGYTLTLTSAIAQTQTVDLQNAGGFYPSVINVALDKLTILIQQIQSYFVGVLKLPLSAGSNVSATLPTPSGDKVLGWNSAGTALVNLVPTSSSVAVPQTGTSKSAVIPNGTTAQRDSVPSFGYTRANSTNGSVEWWNGADWRQLANSVDGPLAGYRNLIINGDMRIGQRFGNATSASVLANGSYSYFADRWMVSSFSTGGGNTVQWSTGITGQPFRTALGVIGLAPMQGVWFRQRIEAANLSGLLGKTVTLSYKVFGTKVMGFGLSTYASAGAAVPTATDNYTSTTVLDPITSHDVAMDGGEWQTGYITFVLPLTAPGLEITIGVSAGGDGATWPIGDGAYITQVQLEEGTVATPFETRPYATELALCQRYLPAFYGINYFPSYATSTTTVRGILKFPVEARVAPTGVAQPTGSLTANFQANGLTPSAINFDAAGKSTATLQLVVSGATSGAPGFFGCLSGSGGLLFNGCEL